MSERNLSLIQCTICPNICRSLYFSTSQWEQKQNQEGLLITYSVFLKQHWTKKEKEKEQKELTMDWKKIKQKKNKTFFIIAKWGHPVPPSPRCTLGVLGRLMGAMPGWKWAQCLTKDTLVEFSFPPEGNRNSDLHVFNICVGIASTRGVGNPNGFIELNNPWDSLIPSGTGRFGEKKIQVSMNADERNSVVSCYSQPSRW